MVGLIVGLYSIINTPANILFGQLIDRIGHRAPLIGGLAGNALSMVLYSFTRSPLHLILVRALHGTSGALVAPSTMSIIANHPAAQRRGRSMSLYGIALAGASLVGYPASGLIASRLGFNAVFFFGASAAFIGVLLSLTLPGTSASAGKRPASLRGLQEVRSILSRSKLVPSYVAVFAQYFTFGGVVTLLPLHVQRLGMTSLEIGMLLATFSVVFILTQLPSGAISDRAGRSRPIIAGLLCVIVSLAILPLMSVFVSLALAMALYGAGYGLLFPAISALLTDHTGAEERGLATGLFHALLTAGVAIGAPLMGWLGSLTTTGIGLMMTAIPMLLALVVALRFLRRP